MKPTLSRLASHTNNFQGQFFPFFILTLTGLVTLPLTYSLLKPSKGTHPHSAVPHNGPPNRMLQT
jgi:preprotein translocase subunit Sec63